MKPVTSASRIFLIGYRGAGKSTVARIVADALGWQAVDADEVLEARAGRSIQQIFAEDGEPAFRELETATLAELCQRRETVVATGGGVILSEANRQRLRDAGLVVWLTAEAETICRRVAADRTTAERRPALSGAATGDGTEEVRRILAYREPLYRACADLIIDADQRTPEEVAGVLLGLLPQAAMTKHE